MTEVAARLEFDLLFHSRMIQTSERLLIGFAKKQLEESLLLESFSGFCLTLSGATSMPRIGILS
jgi:hypothetical protein